MKLRDLAATVALTVIGAVMVAPVIVELFRKAKG